MIVGWVEPVEDVWHPQELRRNLLLVHDDRLVECIFRSTDAPVVALLEALAVARVSGAYSSALGRLSRVDVLVLDDILLVPMKDAERRDLLEVLEERYERAATMITSQLSSKIWHAALGDPTIEDAICDRLEHRDHELALTGPAMRKKEAPSPSSQTPIPDHPRPFAPIK